MSMKNKFLQRLVLLYFFIQVLPLDAGFWRSLFGSGGGLFSYAGLFRIAHYEPAFSSPPPVWPDWIIFAGIAAFVAFFWTRNSAAQDEAAQSGTDISAESLDAAAQYWVRTLVRYRLAIAMLAYGFIKLFP